MLEPGSSVITSPSPRIPQYMRWRTIVSILQMGKLRLGEVILAKVK